MGRCTATSSACVSQGSFELIAQVAPKAVARILEGMARRMSAGVGASGQCAESETCFETVRPPFGTFKDKGASSALHVVSVAKCNWLTAGRAYCLVEMQSAMPLSCACSQC